MENAIGKYGMLHLDYIKTYRKGTYATLIMEGRLNDYLLQIDANARKTVSRLVKEYAEQRRINEQMKSTDPMRWVQEMNNCKACAEDFVLKEMVYA